MSSEQIKILYLSIILVVCLFFSGLFSCCDMVYSSCNKLTLAKKAEEGNKRAKLALELAEKYDETISTVVFSNNLVNIASSSACAIASILIFIELGSKPEFADAYAPYICSIILTMLIIAFGEVLPKVIGRLYADKYALRYARFVRILQIIFFPIVFVTTSFGKLVSKPFMKTSESEEEVTDEELQEMVDVIEEEGIIDESQGELLRSAIEFKETEAHEVMTPRVDVVAFDIDDDINEFIKNDNFYEFSRIPVYEGSIDNIIGILPVKMIIKELLKGNSIDIHKVLIPEINVPSGMNISTILKEFKKSKTHIAIVKDEFGGTEGIVTMEDIVEELVGDIWDEFDTPEEELVQKNENTLIVDGSMNIEDFFNECEMDFEAIETDYDTVGGWCTDVLQKFPRCGDEFDYEKLHITILEADEFTVEKIKVVINDIIEESED